MGYPNKSLSYRETKVRGIGAILCPVFLRQIKEGWMEGVIIQKCFANVPYVSSIIASLTRFITTIIVKVSLLLTDVKCIILKIEKCQIDKRTIKRFCPGTC